jgi:cytoskeletal protein CcmA (bactofilin family)
MEGVCKVDGDIRAEEFRLNGVSTVRGSVEANSFLVSGKLKIEGGVKAEQAATDGLVEIAGSLTGHEGNLNGLLKIRGDCEFERLKAAGGFEVGGMLNAGFADIALYGQGKAREIGCESLRVRKIAKSGWKEALRKMFPRWKPELTAHTIEGDDLDLENTAADVVRGNRVAIGPGCRIGCVEYRLEYRKHPGAKVGKELKVGE